MMSREALVFPEELVSEIAIHLQPPTLCSFVLVSDLFFRAGTPRLWENQTRLEPLLQVLDQQTLDNSHWNRFSFYAGLIKSLYVCMEGSNKVFKTIFKRMPKCFTRLNDLTISLTPHIKTLNFFLKLAANSPLLTIRIQTKSDLHYALSEILKPLHSTTSLMGLMLETHPAQSSFWSSLVPSWKGLTDVCIDTGEEVDDVGTVLGSLSMLPLLCNLEIDSVEVGDSPDQYIFPNLRSLQVKFFNKPTGFIANFSAPHLALIHIGFLVPSDEPTWSNIFRMIDQCNPTRTLLTIVVEIERDYDTTPEIPDELPRDESFNEKTLRPLYVFHRLESLQIRPGLSCHLLTNEFYASLPMYWPMLKTFHLGGDLFFPTPDPVATLEGVVAILDGCQHIRVLCIPHFRGGALSQTSETYGTLKSIGNIFGGYVSFWAHLEWITTSLPSVTDISMACSSYGDQAEKCKILSKEFQQNIWFDSVEIWIED